MVVTLLNQRKDYKMNLTALDAIKYAMDAYKTPEQSEHLSFISVMDTQVVLRFFGDSVVISFRGTEDIKDFTTNVKFFKIEFPEIGKGSLHIGFREAYETVRMAIVFELKKHKIYNVYFASHSLGAALSIICAQDITHNHKFRVRKLHLFGCPRVFDIKLAKEYDVYLKDITYRWQNNCDIVCRIPSINYKHVGKLVYIDRNKKIHCNSSYWQRFKDRFIGRIKGFAKFKICGISNHSEYEKLLTGNIKSKALIVGNE